MSYGIQNMHSYNIHQENEAMNVVSHLNEMSIIDITRQDYFQRYDFTTILPITNLPGVIEQMFKQTQEMYPENIQELENTKNHLYRVILDTISALTNIVFDNVDDQSLYGYTYYVYDFIISNFKQYMILFFNNYIIKEKNTIYNEMNLAAFRKEKNSTAKYGKSTYTNQKIAMISAYLDKVITNMSVFDISIETILSNIYNNNAITNMLSGIKCNNFYQEQYITLLNTPLIRQSIISNIRFAIHNSMI